MMLSPLYPRIFPAPQWSELTAPSEPFSESSFAPTSYFYGMITIEVTVYYDFDTWTKYL